MLRDYRNKRDGRRASEYLPPPVLAALEALDWAWWEHDQWASLCYVAAALVTVAGDLLHNRALLLDALELTDWLEHRREQAVARCVTLEARCYAAYGLEILQRPDYRWRSV